MNQTSIGSGIRGAGVALAVTTMLACGGGPATAQAPPNASSSLAALYGRLPAIADMAISPDGSMLALAENDGARQIVRVANLDSGATLMAVGAQPGQTIRGVDWGDDRIALGQFSVTYRQDEIERWGYMILGGKRLHEYFRVAALDIDTREVVLPMDREKYSWAMNNLASLRTPIAGDPGTGRIVLRMEPDFERHGLYRVDLKSGKGTLLRRFAGETDQVVIDDKGAPVVRSVRTDNKKNTWEIRVIEGETERVVGTGESLFGSAPEFAGLLDDGRLGLFTDDGPGGTRRLSGLDLKTGAVTPVFAVNGYDLAIALKDPWSARVVGVQWTDAMSTRQAFFAPDLQKAYEAVQAALPDGFARITSWSRDLARITATAMTPKAPTGAHIVFDVATKRVQQIGATYPGLGAWASVQSITYPARDGVRVPAILTMPETAGSGPAPMVVLIHGGPSARDDGEFDWWAQFLAARGYLVLQSNFRGSDGFGRAWERAGYGQWGGVMSRDVEDGVRAMIRTGTVDPKRICFIGASYGAYAALTAAMQAPDLVRCAAGIGGVYDLPKLLKIEGTATTANEPRADWLETSIGSMREDGPALIAASPARNANAIRAPVLLMHGTQDSVVGISQTRAMRDALAAAGNIPAYVELKGDDHWLSAAATRTRMLEELDGFLATHLAPPKP